MAGQFQWNKKVKADDEYGCKQNCQLKFYIFEVFINVGLFNIIDKFTYLFELNNEAKPKCYSNYIRELCVNIAC